jgi:hypothetical protein
MTDDREILAPLLPFCYTFSTFPHLPLLTPHTLAYFTDLPHLPHLPHLPNLLHVLYSLMYFTVIPDFPDFPDLPDLPDLPPLGLTICGDIAATFAVGMLGWLQYHQGIVRTVVTEEAETDTLLVSSTRDDV